jgi:protein ImuB
MRWLALYLPQLPLEVFEHGRQQAGPLAVVEGAGGRERICRCNAAALACGVRPGLAVPAALALDAGLALCPRDRRREQVALNDLAAWAYQFSPRIAFEPSALLLEVGASERLFGGRARLLRSIQRECVQLGHAVQQALAPTPTAAGLLARLRPGSEVPDRAGLADVVRPLPLSGLTRDARVRRLMRDIGLDSIGDALDLPRPELARRAGPALARLLDRLLGAAPDPRPEWRPPAVFVQGIELAGEIRHAAALVFPARRLMVALCGFLRGHGAGAQRLQWRLGHHERPETVFDQGLLDPSRDPDHMLEVFRERIERVDLPAPVLGLVLQVDDWLTFAERDRGLFGDDGPDHALLERLGNRLGDARVRGLRCQADHRPERAWRLCPPGEPPDALSHTPVGPAPAAPWASSPAAGQPPWLLEQPRPLEVHDDRPRYGGDLRLEPLPQRIESGWWDGGDIARDYFVAHSPAGERLWVYRDRRSGGWYLHGLFA